MTQEREYRNRPTHKQMTTFGKGTKAIQQRKDSLFNNWCWKNIGEPYTIKWNFNQCFASYIIIKSQITDLNIKPKTIKVLDESIRKNHFDLWLA